MPRTILGYLRNCFGHLWCVTAMRLSQGIWKSTTPKLLQNVHIWKKNSRGVSVSDGAERAAGGRGDQSLLGVEVQFLVPVQKYFILHSKTSLIMLSPMFWCRCTLRGLTCSDPHHCETSRGRSSPVEGRPPRPRGRCGSSGSASRSPRA